MENLSSVRQHLHSFSSPSSWPCASRIQAVSTKMRICSYRTKTCGITSAFFLSTSMNSLSLFHLQLLFSSTTSSTVPLKHHESNVSPISPTMLPIFPILWKNSIFIASIKSDWNTSQRPTDLYLQLVMHLTAKWFLPGDWKSDSTRIIFCRCSCAVFSARVHPNRFFGPPWSGHVLSMR